MNQFRMTAHAQHVIESKGFTLDAVEAVWRSPDITYPSHRHPGQHKRVGEGLCLACDDVTGLVITVFVDKVNTELRPDQRTDRDATEWARRNGMA